MLKGIYEATKAFDHNGTDADIKKLFQDMLEGLNRPYKSMHCHNFVINLLRGKDNLFQFVKNPDVEGTNDRAERALRHSVIARKISGGSRSQKGAKIYEKLTSIYHTLCLKNQNILTHGPKIIQTSHG